VPTSLAPDPTATALRQLHASLLACWNWRNADGFAALFAPEGNLVGFDGSPVDGSQAIAGMVPPGQTQVNSQIPDTAAGLTAELQRQWDATHARPNDHSS
jgi:hypothetical protein